MNKILLVDDDRELTSLLKELLEMEGFNVIVAHDGEQALDLLDDSIDLLLLDVMMPKKNGIDTLKALRQTHQTPVIMLTARGSELDRVLGLELGADGYRTTNKFVNDAPISTSESTSAARILTDPVYHHAKILISNSSEAIAVAAIAARLTSRP